MAKSTVSLREVLRARPQDVVVRGEAADELRDDELWDDELWDDELWDDEAEDDEL